jgi:glycerate-2-kinase
MGNWTALEAAHQKALELGFNSSIADDICEQPVQEGCELLLARMSENTDCLISGGEFSCPVRGDGIGGRNMETVLRCALEERNVVVLSAGTDGIDGNSSAAGAVADPTTISRARNLGLDPAAYLARSDSFTFFEQLQDLIVTGPTGTNVRDVRILLKTPLP